MTQEEADIECARIKEDAKKRMAEVQALVTLSPFERWYRAIGDGDAIRCGTVQEIAEFCFNAGRASMGKE